MPLNPFPEHFTNQFEFRVRFRNHKHSRGISSINIPQYMTLLKLMLTSKSE